MGLWFGALLGAPALAEPVITDEARRHFGAGVALLDDRDGPRYEEAYLAFRAAYAAAPSPKILGNLGLCAMMLERDGEAIDAYERYLREVEDIEPREREQIERDLETLRATAARLTVEAPAGTTIVDRRQPV
jgi:Tfp pilus assembly protein PilF